MMHYNVLEQSPRWRGDLVGYFGLHDYLRRHMPKPESCEFCHQKSEKLDVACITGIYNRDFKNFRYLCRGCHRRYDIAQNKTQNGGRVFLDHSLSHLVKVENLI